MAWCQENLLWMQGSLEDFFLRGIDSEWGRIESCWASGATTFFWGGGGAWGEVSVMEGHSPLLKEPPGNPEMGNVWFIFLIYLNLSAPGPTNLTSKVDPRIEKE